MSGGGNGDSDFRSTSTGAKGKAGGSGGGGAGADPCDITEQTVLNSPNAAVLAKVRVGDKLTVEVMTSPRRLVAKKGADIAGTITSSKMPQFIACIEKGVTFSATVVKLSGGRCEVRVARD